MCQVSTLSCRLCMADNISAPYVDLKEDVARAEAVYHLLCLQWSLTNIGPGQPQHVCGLCDSVMTAFERLRDTALRNEAMINVNIKRDPMVMVESKYLEESVSSKDNDETFDYESDEAALEEENNDTPVDIPSLSVKRECSDEETFEPKKKRSRVWSNFKGCSKEEKKIVSKRVMRLTKQAVEAAGWNPCDSGNAWNDMKLECPLCAKAMVGKYNLTRHLRRLHTAEELSSKTPDIGKVEAALESPSKSKRGRTKENVQRVKEILEKACALIGIDVNDEEAVRNAEFSCYICGKGPFHKTALAFHVDRVHKAPDFFCSVEGCNSVFKSKGDLNRHVKFTHMDKELCTICGESFKYIDQHIQSTHCNVNFTCEFCDKEYNTQTGLKLHIKNHHSGLAKEVCQYCAKEVRDIKQHIKFMHGDLKEKTLACKEPGCDQMFKTEYSARKHYDSVHLNIKHQCSECGGHFKNLSTHVSEVHKNKPKKRYICPECGNIVAKIQEHLRKTHQITDFKTKDIQVIYKDLNHTI